jgi:agmatine deiminase
MKNIFFTFIAFFLIFSLYAQNDLPLWKKLRYLSEEEMYMEVRSGRNFIETDPPEGKIRNVAEFDPMQAVLVRYPFGVPLTFLKEIAKEDPLIIICEDNAEENEVRESFDNYGVNLDNCSFIYAPTNSWWVRDYGPWFVFDGSGKPGIVDFPYNRPRPRDNDIPAKVAEHLGIDLYGMNILHTGGNYMTDGLGKSSSTDLILEENPEMTEEEVDNKLRHYLAIENYYVLPDPLDDYIKHIDCWGKFLTPNKVIIGQVDESDYRYEDFEEVASFFESTTSSYGVPYEVFRVYTPGLNQTTPYTNSLIVNDRVFVPITGSQWDDEALAAYEEALPGYEIIGIYHWGWYNTDALHCRTKGVADLDMLYIEHRPVLGESEYTPEMEFVADITAYSGTEVYLDSVYLIYTLNELQALFFTTFQKEADGLWYASINELRPGDHISYYIEAKDASGRTAMHPFIGHHDPHEFQLKTVYPDISINPDTLLFDSFNKLKFGQEISISNELPTHTVITGVEVPDDPAYTLEHDFSSTFVLEKDSEMSIRFRFLEPLPEMGTYLTDTIFIKTEYFDYPVVFTIDRTGVQTFEMIQNKLQVYPNPAKREVRFTLGTEFSGNSDLSITNTSGQIVYREKIDLSGGLKVWTWDLRDDAGRKIAPGLYFYQVRGEDTEYKGEIVVE